MIEGLMAKTLLSGNGKREIREVDDFLYNLSRRLSEMVRYSKQGQFYPASEAEKIEEDWIIFNKMLSDIIEDISKVEDKDEQRLKIKSLEDQVDDLENRLDKSRDKLGAQERIFSDEIEARKNDYDELSKKAKELAEKGSFLEKAIADQIALMKAKEVEWDAEVGSFEYYKTETIDLKRKNKKLVEDYEGLLGLVASYKELVDKKTAIIFHIGLDLGLDDATLTKGLKEIVDLEIDFQELSDLITQVIQKGI
jgi:chromosome segregation ATPase